MSWRAPTTSSAVISPWGIAPPRLDRAGHLERARSIFETLGCQADLAATGRAERETGVENTAR